jgi:tRNA-Thr(GGU) m(6)t(6)A37 methyltransferase TsaA
VTHHGDAQRPGETRLEALPASEASLVFVGVIRTPFVGRQDCPRQGDPDAGPECRIELDPLFEPALDGLEAYPRIEVLYWLHKARRDLLTQSPRGKHAIRGSFSLRSPLRPNPIGTSAVRLLRREGPVLIVRGLDCLDGTPLLDLKPLRCEYTVQALPKDMP